MRFAEPGGPNYRTIVVTAVLGSLAAAAVGWLASSFELGRTISLDTAQIAQLQIDVQTLSAASRQFPSRQEFAAFQAEELQHWAEQHDFFVRQDARTDEIVRDHARIMAIIEAREKGANKQAGGAIGSGN